MVLSQEELRSFYEEPHPCPYCNTEMTTAKGKFNSITRDHVVAKCKGGRDTILVCYTCNQEKAALSLREFLTRRLPASPSTVFNLLSHVESYLSTPNDRRLFKLENYGEVTLLTPSQEKAQRNNKSRQAKFKSNRHTGNYNYPPPRPSWG